MPQQPETRTYEFHQPQAEGAEMFPAEVLATLSHEFRGPLTTILGYTTTLLQHDQRLMLEERQDFLRAIHEAGLHLEKLVERFLELASLEVGPTSVTPDSVDLLALAHEAITAVRARQQRPLLFVPSEVGQSQVSSAGQTPQPQEDFLVVGDLRLLRIMLDVLLENAVAYSPPERPIEVSIHPTDATRLSALSGPEARQGTHIALALTPALRQQEPLVEIQVRDHGTGIAPEHLERIFQRFYRGDTRLTREVNGPGLGLTLARAIVARHHGMLWVESKVGEGSTFHIVLPEARA